MSAAFPRLKDAPQWVLRRLQSWRDRKREEENDAQFPDEIDTPLDVPARTRFQRYRGLRSFRTSPWDPYENLPRDYARIFQFEDFKRTERVVKRRAEEQGGVEVSICLLFMSTMLVLIIPSIIAWHPSHTLPQRRPQGSSTNSFRSAIRSLQPTTARAQEDCPQLHRAEEYRVRWLSSFEGMTRLG